MFHRILVPTNFSDSDLEALAYAEKLADKNGEITLIHAIEPIPHLNEKEDQAFYDRLRARAAEKMSRLLAQHHHKSIAIKGEVLMGKRWECIVGFAEEHHIQLIVMSSHPVDRRRDPAHLGSVSHRVAIMAPCPIFLVKGQPAPYA